MSNAARQAAYRYPWLDLLRFCAAAAVVVYHYKSVYVDTLPAGSALRTDIYAVTKFGYLGVDLFFLISGFVILLSASGRDASQFAIARVLRVYPTLWACASLTAVTCLLLGSDDIPSVSEWATSLTLLSPYFDRPYVDGVYWTLLIELKFYCCVFVLMCLGWLDHYRVWLPAWLAATISFRLFGQPYFLGWFISPEYSPLFIAGIVIFRATREGWQPFHWSMLAACLVLSSSYEYQAIETFTRNVTNVDRWVAAGLVGGLFLVFGMGASLRAGDGRGSLIGFLGGLTYPLYLLHDRIGKELFAAMDRPTAALLRLLVITAIVVLTAAIVHLIVERRIADRIKNVLLSLLEQYHVRKNQRMLLARRKP
ncbi:MAG: acyltransferase [Sinobacteraceae bacterium]|nr:acyltransferase [Nevskiaceae bacterium]MCP5470718.1 acyltransferase [Nevskiaceae bacterium]